MPDAAEVPGWDWHIGPLLVATVNPVERITPAAHALEAA